MEFAAFASSQQTLAELPVVDKENLGELDLISEQEDDYGEYSSTTSVHSLTLFRYSDGTFAQFQTWSEH
jgi:hypothetical protein